MLAELRNERTDRKVRIFSSPRAEPESQTVESTDFDTLMQSASLLDQL